MTTVDAKKSTIVRPKIDWRMRWLRLTFAAAERVAPGLGGRRAALLWCTPPSGRERRRDDRPAAPSRQHLLRTGRLRLAVQTWGAADHPPVYLVHGWGGWRGQLGEFVPPLLAAGRRVVAFDMPSHGESGPGSLGPRRATAADMADALAAVVAEFGRPAGMVAHSLGCTASLVACCDGTPTGRLALVAPAADPLGRLGEFIAVLGAGERTEAALRHRLVRYGRRPLADFAVAQVPLPAERPPMLVVHDRTDKEIPFDDGRGLAERWSAAEFMATDGLGHQRILRDAGVVARVADFLSAGVR